MGRVVTFLIIGALCIPGIFGVLAIFELNATRTLWDRGVQIATDPETGCDYLIVLDMVVTPRLTPSGVIYCRPKEK